MGTKQSTKRKGLITLSSPSSSILSYSGNGSFIGRIDKKGRRSGMGVECFGYGLATGIAYAGEWKDDQWHGWGISFVPPSLISENVEGDPTIKVEWFVGKFKNGQLNGDGVQYDLSQNVHKQGIWRKNEIALTQKVHQKYLMRARKKVGEALSLARRIEASVLSETTYLE
jgi:hypothetical protein